MNNPLPIEIMPSMFRTSLHGAGAILNSSCIPINGNETEQIVNLANKSVQLLAQRNDLLQLNKDLLAQRDALQVQVDERTVKLNVALDERDHLASVNDALLNALQIAVATIERIVPQHGPFNSAQGTLDVAKAALALAQKGPL